jgi:hypothetical protein
LVQSCLAQDDESPVTKIGGMYYGKNPSLSYSLCFERERLFARKSFSRGPRVDFDEAKPAPQTYSTMSLVLGYQFKYYPLYPVRGDPTRGFFLGVNPCYFVKVRDQYQYGPGVGFLMGYQGWIMNKIALSFELDITNMRNVNQSLSAGLPNSWYLYAFSFFKVGYRFSKG